MSNEFIEDAGLAFSPAPLPHPPSTFLGIRHARKANAG